MTERQRRIKYLEVGASLLESGVCRDGSKWEASIVKVSDEECDWGSFRPRWGTGRWVLSIEYESEKYRNILPGKYEFVHHCFVSDFLCDPIQYIETEVK
jgi:hypothetical protein